MFVLESWRSRLYYKPEVRAIRTAGGHAGNAALLQRAVDCGDRVIMRLYSVTVKTIEPFQRCILFSRTRIKGRCEVRLCGNRALVDIMMQKKTTNICFVKIIIQTFYNITYSVVVDVIVIMLLYLS